MKQFCLYLLLLIASIFCSCRNYTKEFNKLAIELENKGSLIDKNEKLHMVLYEEDGCVKANDLDTCWVVFSPHNQLNTYQYQIDIDNKGINVNTKVENINIVDFSYSKYNGLSSSNSIVTDSNGRFSYFRIKIYPKEENNIKSYEYDSRHSDFIIPKLSRESIAFQFGEQHEDFEDLRNDFWYSTTIDASFISNKLNILYKSYKLDLKPLPGKLSIYFKTGEDGNVKETADIMKYEYEDYKMLYKVDRFKKIEDVSNFYNSINMEISKVGNKIFINSEKHKYIEFEDLQKVFNENHVKANKNFKGKKLRIACTLSNIKWNNNLFQFLNYKYKLLGFEKEMYSNDENFENLEYPVKVYMEATLHSYEFLCVFTDCKLIMAE